MVHRDKCESLLSANFTLLDTFVMLSYLIVVIAIGFYYSGKKDQSFNDYFLAGKNVGWFAVGMSIFATNISSEHFIGLAGAGATRGLAVGQIELMAIFILILLGWVVAPIYMKSGVVTTPEFLERKFDSSLRRPFAALSIVIYIFTKITVSLFAGGILFYKLFGMSIYTSAVLVVLFTGLYAILGGANAVIRTSVPQGIVLIAGAVLLTAFGLNAVGGFSGLEHKLPSDFFHMFKPASDPDYPWTGVLFGAPIIAFWYWLTDQYFIQKVLSAKSINDARRGSLFAASLKVLPLFVLVLPGLLAAVIFPGLSGDQTYPTLLASSLLPSGVKGVVVAGLLAAIMSSLASTFNATAALITNDFYKPKHPRATDRELVLVGRLTTTATVVVAILSIPLVKLITSQVYLFLQSIQGFVSPPIAAVFLVAFISKEKGNTKAAIWTLVVGETVGVCRLICETLVKSGSVDNPLFRQITNINFLHFSIFLFLFSVMLFLSLSILLRERFENKTLDKKIDGSTAVATLGVEAAGNTAVGTFRSNALFSVLILLVVASLWSIWF